MIISKRHKKMLLDLIETHLPENIEVIAFGSRVDGTAHEASDLDLALINMGENKLNRSIFHKFVWAVKESNIPFLIDILDFHSIPSYMQKIIKESGIIMREANVTYKVE